MARKLVLIHGYSDQGPSFKNWASKLRDHGVDATQINICSYISLNNEVTIPDIAEGLGRATDYLGWPPEQEFDAIVHSTGMLVIRAWLCNNETGKNISSTLSDLLLRPGGLHWRMRGEVGWRRLCAAITSLVRIS